VTTSDNSTIRVLKGLEAVRLRPGMYIGSTDQRGLHHLVYEIVDNSLNQALIGTADRIDVIIGADGVVMVGDNGPGIPVEMHPFEQKPVLELLMTQILTGRGFDVDRWMGQHGAIAEEETELPKGKKSALIRNKTSSWRYGVGAPVVNALSEWMRVEVRYEGKVYAQEYERGVPKGPVAVVGEDLNGRGTTTSFKVDPTILQTTNYDQNVLVERFRELCYLTRGLTIHFVDERVGREREERFCFPDGIRSWVEHLNRDRHVLHAPFYVSRTIKETDVEVALQYNDSDIETIRTYVNNLFTSEGGTHLAGFQAALTRTLNNYAKKNGCFRGQDGPLTGDDVRAGLTAVISVGVVQPRFVYATTNKLGNAEVRGHVQSAVGPALMQFLEENPNDARKIVENCLATARGRVAR
jgi:DNA gyrase subunit B